MVIHVRLLFVLSACAFYLPQVHGMERIGDAASLYQLERYANEVASLRNEFETLIQAASTEERFSLYWTANHLAGSWIQVEYLQTALELSMAAQSDSDEASLRAGVRDLARFVHWELGYAIDDLERNGPELARPAHVHINAVLRSLLWEVRASVDRLWADQCARVPCVAGP